MYVAVSELLTFHSTVVSPRASVLLLQNGAFPTGTAARCRAGNERQGVGCVAHSLYGHGLNAVSVTIEGGEGPRVTRHALGRPRRAHGAVWKEVSGCGVLADIPSAVSPRRCVCDPRSLAVSLVSTSFLSRLSCPFPRTVCFPAIPYRLRPLHYGRCMVDVAGPRECHAGVLLCACQSLAGQHPPGKCGTSLG
jgi:hypothetical protein